MVYAPRRGELRCISVLPRSPPALALLALPPPPDRRPPRPAFSVCRGPRSCAVGGTLRPLDIVRTESLNTLDVHTRDRVLARSYCLLLSMAPMVPVSLNGSAMLLNNLS